jgi:YfiH family protein
MSFRTSGEICYFQFESFERVVDQGIFTRRGGISPEPWATLNLGGTVGDDVKRVLENRHRALAALGREPNSVYDVWQVHGVNVVVADAPRLPETPHLQADAILTNRPGLTLMMRFADCVPIFLHDPVCKVVGIVHAGWLGTVRGVVTFAVEAMKSRFGTNPADIFAGIGPSIGPDHYEIGADVANQVHDAFESDASSLLIRGNGHISFDLWSATRVQLARSGIKQIETAGLCTACNKNDWFSHRGEHGRTGRFGAIISLH